MKLAQVGDFSVSNWSDRLYPGVTRRLLRRIGMEAEVAHFAPLAGATLAGEPIRPLREIRRSKVSAVLVGGGDLIRLDTATVALDHMAIPEDQRRGRLLRLRAELFARRHFLTGPGAWLPDADWVPGTPTVLVSVGARRMAHDARARAAVSRLEGVWVRTSDAAHQFEAAGVRPERIVRAPDMFFAHPALSDQPASAERGHQIVRDRLGVDEPLVVFHAAAIHGWPEARVEAALRSLRGLPVAVLSLGAHAGEDRALTAAAQRTRTSALIGLKAEEIIYVLASAGVVFTTSPHVAIVAGSFGTPVLTPGVAKTADVFSVCPSPPQVEGVSDEDLADTVRARRGKRAHHDHAPNAAAATTALASVLTMAGVL
ncbi:polysaccharide pyruvyl transferase family protein [Microbacterium oleivorans]|uniref:polysaccharide pyruvyl transferase family protein n=1 Tax=Microbacterium oleivorans TaxID=273677 RepID=UPI0012FCE3D6|nr:polysaccharide pyruvyl transferase family protein [Microbacterium oleivorans]